MNRDTVFIGHANPEDNEFTLWLYAKLTNEGYKVICDLTFLTGGESDYWKDLDNALNQACKYILVFSKDTFSKSGVLDEWEHVRSMAKREGLKDFIMLLKVDDVPFDERIGTNRMNHFRFDFSWANGLKKLIYKLESDSVPVAKRSKLSIEEWQKNKYTTFSGVSEKDEDFYSNWLEISEVPDFIYFHEYQTSKQAASVNEELDEFPSIVLDNYIITFVKDTPTYVTKHQLEIKPNKSFEMDSSRVFQEYHSDKFPKYHDLRKLFVRLIRTAFELHLDKMGLKKYELSGGKGAFFYEVGQLEKDRANFQYRGKTKRKNLVGAYHESFWHYAISTRPLLSPFFCFSLKSHLLFSDDGKNIWASKSKLHSARRSKGRSFFNKDWRNFLLGFLSAISKDGESIEIKLTETAVLRLPVSTIMFTCNEGYDEPKDKARLVPIDYSEELEEWMNDTNEEGNDEP